MHNDEVGDVARSDRLITVLGNKWMEKNMGNTLKRGKYTSEIMRLVARLLIALRKVTDKILSMWDFLAPENFDNIVVVISGQYRVFYNVPKGYLDVVSVSKRKNV